MLKKFGRDIWTADGSNVTVVGFCYPTRMAVIRLSKGDLFIWSPIQLTDGLRAEVDAIGRVRHIVAPNSLHHLFLAEWQRAYPRALLYAPPGLRKKRRDIVFDAELGSRPSQDWGEEIDQVLVHGNLITTEVPLETATRWTASLSVPVDLHFFRNTLFHHEHPAPQGVDFRHERVCTLDLQDGAQFLLRMPTRE